MNVFLAGTGSGFSCGCCLLTTNSGAVWQIIGGDTYLSHQDTLIAVIPTLRFVSVKPFTIGPGSGISVDAPGRCHVQVLLCTHVYPYHHT